MAPKIFATGATGYIGGTVLDTIISAHPDYSITVLVRSDEKAAPLKSAYPSIQTVIGDLDSSDVITSAVKDADIVLHFADCDHVSSATTIVSTLAASQSPKYLIHTSGSAILSDISKPELFGTEITPDLEYNDVTTLSTITSFPVENHPHRNVDTIVLGAGGKNNTNVAIVCPSCIYGQGTGKGNTKSMQVPWLVEQILKHGKAFTVNGGKNRWNNVHVQDLAKLYLMLTEAAVNGGKGADWNKEGYYFCENGEFVWGDLSREIAKRAKAKGYLKTDEVDDLSNEEVTKLHPFGHVLWGSNSKGKAERARKLGWTPKEASLWDTLDETIEQEAKALGL
ncbi:nucleoside-diphosphate-sugar epimerase [Trichophaea hybrida]|nr:nucleoside-diphosphate-sugar epimerase [Trichophaea hybrida]